MKCIGRECNYNKCNAGNYCGLSSACFTQEGDSCIINEEIEAILDELNAAKDGYERLLLQKEKIINSQNLHQ